MVAMATEAAMVATGAATTAAMVAATGAVTDNDPASISPPTFAVPEEMEGRFASRVIARRDGPPDFARGAGDVSGEDRLDDLARDVGQAEVAALGAVGQPLVIDAHQVQDRGVQVVDADAVDDRLVAELVGLAVVSPPLDAAAGQPGGKGVRVVVAAGPPLLHDRQAAELAVADDQGLIE